MASVRTITQGLAVAVVALSVVVGIPGGCSDLSEASSPGQLVVTIADLTFGTTGLAALVGYHQRRPWALAAIYLWAGSIVVAASVAPVAWGGSEAWTGALAGSATAAVAAWVVATWRARLRSPTATGTAS